MHGLTSSASAGAMASFVTNPLDLAKLRYQVVYPTLLSSLLQRLSRRHSEEMQGHLFLQAPCKFLAPSIVLKESRDSIAGRGREVIKCGRCALFTVFDCLPPLSSAVPYSQHRCDHGTLRRELGNVGALVAAEVVASCDGWITRPIDTLHKDCNPHPTQQGFYSY